MNHKFLLAAALVTSLAMVGCKSKKTLSQAATVAAPTEEVTEVASVTYATPKRTTQETPIVQPGDRTEKVTTVNSAEANMLKNYNIIVGSFGSKDNAEAQKNKMIGRGYKSFLVQNESGLYRVVAGGYDTREAAESVRDILRNTYAGEVGTCAEAWLLIPQL